MYMYKTAKINITTSHRQYALRIISTAHDVRKLIFDVLYVPLNGPYTLL